MRGRLARYALYQARDYWVERGLPTLILGAILLLLPIQLARLGGMEPEQAKDFLINVLPVYAFGATLIATNGIVSNDRTKGYFRFYFAKPVSLTRFYVQAFLLHGLGVVLCGAAFLASFSFLVADFFPPRALFFLAIFYLAWGGLAFFFSTVTRFDWVCFSVVWVMSTLLRSLDPTRTTWYHRFFDTVLPPAHRIPDVVLAVVRDYALAPATLAWIGGYGLAGFIAGLIVLRLKPIGL